MFDARSETLTGSMVASVHLSSANSYGLQHLMRVLMQRRYWIIGSIVICVVGRYFDDDEEAELCAYGDDRVEQERFRFFGFRTR